MAPNVIERVRQLVVEGGMTRAGLARAAGLHANTLRDCTEAAWNPSAALFRWSRWTGKTASNACAFEAIIAVRARRTGSSAAISIAGIRSGRRMRSTGSRRFLNNRMSTPSPRRSEPQPSPSAGKGR